MKVAFCGLFSVSSAIGDAASLEQIYRQQQDDACSQVESSIPMIPDAAAAAFMQAYQSFNGTGSEDAVLSQARKLLSLSDVAGFLSLPDSFTSGGLDAALAKCAVMKQATPESLAAFAARGASQKKTGGPTPQ